MGYIQREMPFKRLLLVLLFLLLLACVCHGTSKKAQLTDRTDHLFPSRVNWA